MVCLIQSYRVKSFIWLLLIFWFKSFSDSRNEFKFPKSLDIIQEIQTIPEGWKSSANDNYFYPERITVYQGSPEDQISLKFNKIIKKKNKTYYIWKLENDTESNQFWISIKYLNSSLSLLKTLPENVTELKVIYNNTNIIFEIYFK